MAATSRSSCGSCQVSPAIRERGRRYCIGERNAHPTTVNWQIEGTDNNDLWWNIPAVNQGGVNGIAGIVLPLDAIDQFSFVTSSSPETGRNPGGTANLVIKSGTNQFHGTGYDFNRNEALAANTPFANGYAQERDRFIIYGGSVGGPIFKDKTFFFVTTSTITL